MKEESDNLKAQITSGDDLLRINVRGRLFEVDRGCLLRQPGSRLYQLAQYQSASCPPAYFNRNSIMFEHIVDYHVSGQLHFPHSLCMKAVNDELTFWGLDDSHLAPCCYARYKEFSDVDAKLEAMQTQWDFELDMKAESSAIVRSGDTSLRTRIHLFLEEPITSKGAKAWATFVQIVTVISLSIVVLETLPSLRCESDIHLRTNHTKDQSEMSDSLSMMATTRPCLHILIMDYITVIFLTVELTLRLIFTPHRRKFCTSFLNVCDFISLLPSYGTLALGGILLYGENDVVLSRTLTIMSCVRIIRIFRLFRIAQYYVTMRMVGEALKESYQELLLLLFLLFAGSVFFASLLFYSELTISNIEHIPLAIWWALITMTTVGYGDYHPMSGGGYFVGALCSITGILIIALPTPIIVNNFNRLYNAYQTCRRLAQRRKDVKQRINAEIHGAESSINSVPLMKSDMNISEVKRRRKKSSVTKCKVEPMQNGTTCSHIENT